MYRAHVGILNCGCRKTILVLGNEQLFGPVTVIQNATWFRNYLSFAFFSVILDKLGGLFEILVGLHATALQLGLHEVPREGYRIPPVLGGVVFPYRVLKEILGFFLRLRDVEGSQNDGGDLQDRDDDNEEAVGGQEDAGFLDGTAVAQETDDEDKCTGSDENVSTLLNHGRFCQFLENAKRFLRVLRASGSFF